MGQAEHRQALPWSRASARQAGLTPAQHQLLLAVKGHRGGQGPTVGDLAGYLLLRPHSTAELIDRAEAAGLVERRGDDGDGRLTRVRLTPEGGSRLNQLAAAHPGEGKQPGAPGSYLTWSDDPDDTVPLFPQGACACGRDLAGAADLGVAASHQVIDTPLVTATVTQYDGHAVECACGRLHQAAPPPDAGAPGRVTYGLNIQAWVVFLMVAHHVPVERCAQIIEPLSGARPSDGFVHAMLARAAKAVRAANMLIRALVITAAVICADETPPSAPRGALLLSPA
ncbi:MAG: MarR family transcriptional regulator [Streptosporangiaceae bacterium]